MRVVLAAVAGLLLLAAPAAAQTDVGGSVDSLLSLELVDDPSGFASFPGGAGEYDLAIRTRITSTANRAFVSVADGDVASGNRVGRLAGGSVLDEPLEARAGSNPFEPLDAAVDPILAEFGPVANERVTIRLKQRIGAGERPRGTYTKTLLITLSANAP